MANIDSIFNSAPLTSADAAVAVAISLTVAAGPPSGVRESMVFLSLIGKLSLAEYERILDLLVREGWLRRANHLLFAGPRAEAAMVRGGR